MRLLELLLGMVIWAFCVSVITILMAVGYETHLHENWDHMSLVLVSTATWSSAFGALIALIVYIVTNDR